MIPPSGARAGVKVLVSILHSGLTVCWENYHWLHEGQLCVYQYLLQLVPWTKPTACQTKHAYVYVLSPKRKFGISVGQHQ